MKNFNFDVFCDRFNSLIEGKSQLELSKEMNLSQPVISKLKKHTGQAPSADTVVRIANHFGVSTDWILGLTDVKSTDKATKELCDTLGLSEQSITCLQNGDEYARRSIDWLIKQHIESLTSHCEKLKTILKETENLTIDDLTVSHLEKLRIVKFSLPSIIYNLSNIIALDYANDIEFYLTENNEININFLQNDGERSQQTVKSSSKFPNTRSTSFSYNEIFLTRCLNAIVTALNDTVNHITEKQYIVNHINFLYNISTSENITPKKEKQQEQPNGNDKKEE